MIFPCVVYILVLNTGYPLLNNVLKKVFVNSSSACYFHLIVFFSFFFPVLKSFSASYFKLPSLSINITTYLVYTNRNNVQLYLHIEQEGQILLLIMNVLILQRSSSIDLRSLEVWNIHSSTWCQGRQGKTSEMTLREK